MNMTIQRNGPLTTYNYYKYFPSHEYSQSVSERFFDTLLKIDLINTWIKADMQAGFTNIGWKYELR